MVKGPADVRVAGTQVSAPNCQRFTQQIHGFVVFGQTAECAAHADHEARSHKRLRRLELRDAFGAPGHYVPCQHVAGTAQRVGVLEHAHHELRHLLRGMSLLRLQVALGGQSVDVIDHQARKHDRNDQARRNGLRPAHEKLPRAIAETRRPRLDRAVFEVATNVLRKVGHTLVAAFGLLAHGLEHDGVEIPCQPPRQPERRTFRTERPLLPAGIDRHPYRDAWGRRVGLTDGMLDLGQRCRRCRVRGSTREQLVQQHAQAVDVARGADGLASHLFRARMHRRQQSGFGHGLEFGHARRSRIEQLGDTEVE